MESQTNQNAPEQLQEPEAAKPLNTIERINLLADLANAAQDEELVRAIKARKNGDRLHSLFVKAISDEIEGIMNPAQAAVPKVMLGAQQIAEQIYQMMQRIGGIMQAIEQGPGLFVLQTVAQQLGTRIPQQAQPTYQPPQQPQPQQPQPTVAGNQTVDQPSGRAGRGGMLGSW